VSSLPSRMTDRWQSRPEPRPGQAQLSWHILMRDQPQLRAVAAVAGRRLAAFPGLHVTPEQWLHLSVLRVGLDSAIPPDGLDVMVEQVRQQLRRVPAADVTFGRVLYHPEAVALGMQPDGALDPIAAAIRAAARTALGQPAPDAGVPWIPHVTLAYSTLDQPAGPIIAALGRELPECQLTLDAVSLVAQHGPERDWQWQPLARVLLRT
jgi:hypothetical protein